MYRRVSGTQWLPSLPAKIMSSEEVTLSILRHPGYKHKTEDLEGDSDSIHEDDSSEADNNKGSPELPLDYEPFFNLIPL